MSEILTSWARNNRVREIALSNPAAQELVSRYVAGQDVDNLLPVLHDLVSKGLLVSVEYLGRQVDRPTDAAENLQGYLDLINRLVDENLARGTEISVRLGWLGLELGPDQQTSVLTAARQIGRAASNAGALVTIDMGAASTAEATLRLWRQLHADLPATGITVQSALHRTLDDVAALAMPGNRVRLCKGAFTEPRQVGFRRQHDVDLAFVRSLRTLMHSQAVPLVATHDPRLVAITEELIRRSGRRPGSYEFQMMYGIRPLEQRRLVDIGHPTRVYVPFGPGWYDYYVRRLAERPALAALFARSLVGKR